jgi:uncharacterized membrane protein YdjX (TVP38/TMEM64 family)
MIMATYQGLQDGLRELQLAGSWGVAGILFLFVVGAVSFVPRPALCILAGSAYGFSAIPVAMSGSLIGASLAFWLGCLLKVGLAVRLRRKPMAGSLIDAVRLEGWRIVFLCRLAPIAPSSVQSLIWWLWRLRWVPG